jgi:hypothetical protein
MLWVNFQFPKREIPKGDAPDGKEQWWLEQMERTPSVIDSILIDPVVLLFHCKMSKMDAWRVLQILERHIEKDYIGMPIEQWELNVTTKMGDYYRMTPAGAMERTGDWFVAELNRIDREENPEHYQQSEPTAPARKLSGVEIDKILLELKKDRNIGNILFDKKDEKG